MTIRATTMPSVLGEAAFRLLTSRLDQSPITPQAGTTPAREHVRQRRTSVSRFVHQTGRSHHVAPGSGRQLSLHLFARARVFTVAQQKTRRLWPCRRAVGRGRAR